MQTVGYADEQLPRAAVVAGEVALVVSTAAMVVVVTTALVVVVVATVVVVGGTVVLVLVVGSIVGAVGSTGTRCCLPPSGSGVMRAPRATPRERDATAARAATAT